MTDTKDTQPVEAEITPEIDEAATLMSNFMLSHVDRLHMWTLDHKGTQKNNYPIRVTPTGEIVWLNRAARRKAGLR